MVARPVAIAPASLDQVVPFLRERGPRRDLHDRHHREAVGRAFARVNTCRFMDGSCCAPQMKSLAGVAAKTRPFAVDLFAMARYRRMAEVPDLAIEPSAFSTILARPPRLLPGVGFALRSACPAQGNRHTTPSRESGRGQLLDCRARREQVDGVANLRHFGEQHRRAGAHQQVRRVPDGGIAGHAGKRVAASALQADRQLGRRTGGAASPFSWLTGVPRLHDGGDGLANPPRSCSRITFGGSQQM